MKNEKKNDNLKNERIYIRIDKDTKEKFKLYGNMSDNISVLIDKFLEEPEKYLLNIDSQENIDS